MTDPAVQANSPVVVNDVREETPHIVEPARFPHELRGLAAFLIVDVFIGVWLAINAPQIVTTYAALQVPAFGVAGILWGFLPEDSKKRFGRWVAGLLAHRLVYGTLIVLGAAAAIASCGVAPVWVQSAHADSSTYLKVVRGSRENPVESRVNRGRWQRLDRLTSPVRAYRYVWPRKGWVLTPTHFSSADVPLRPWLPANVTYPDDFVQMATIAFLPTVGAMSEIDSAMLRIASLRDTSLIAEGVMGRHGSFVTYLPPAIVDSVVTIRRTNWIRDSVDTSDTTRKVLFGAWSIDPATISRRWIHTQRPLAVGEEVAYTIEKGSREIFKGTIKLKGGVNDVHLRN